jgi:hypothetical protein
MQEIFIYVCEHASGGLERMVGCLKASVFMTVLEGCMTGQDSGDVEYYRSFLVRERVLRGRFVGESVEPEYRATLLALLCAS